MTPALLVGYFLWKGAWRVLTGCGAGLVLFFFLVPAVFLGWDQNLQALKSWIEVMILPFLVGGLVTPEHNNQSLPGLVARLLTAAPSFSTYIGDIYAPIRYDNFADIGPAAAKWLVKGFMAAFVTSRSLALPSAHSRGRQNEDRGPARLAAGGRVSRSSWSVCSCSASGRGSIIA